MTINDLFVLERCIDTQFLGFWVNDVSFTVKLGSRLLVLPFRAVEIMRDKLYYVIVLSEKQGRKLEKCSMCEFNMVYGFVVALRFTL